MRKDPTILVGSFFYAQKRPKVCVWVCKNLLTLSYRKDKTMKFEFSQEYMGIKDCPLEKWLETHKQQLNSWIYRVYAQGYKDALNDIRKDCDGNVSNEL